MGLLWVCFVQKSYTRNNRHQYSSSSECTAESYVKLQFVDLAGSECIGKPDQKLRTISNTTILQGYLELVEVQ